jgi:hypothetical protein
VDVEAVSPGLLPTFFAKTLVPLLIAGVTGTIFVTCCKTAEVQRLWTNTALLEAISAWQIIAVSALTVISVGIFWLVALTYVTVKKENKVSHIGVLWQCLADAVKCEKKDAKGTETPQPKPRVKPVKPKAINAATAQKTLEYERLKSKLLTENDLEILDCGDGEGSNSCLISSIIASVEKKPGFISKKPACTARRNEMAINAAAIMLDGINASAALTPDQKNVMAWVVDNIRGGNISGKIPPEILTTLRQECDSAKNEIVAVEGEQMYVRRDEYAIKHREHIGRLVRLRFAIGDCDVLIPIDADGIKGYIDAGKQILAEGPSREDLIALHKQALRNEQYYSYLSTSKGGDVDNAHKLLTTSLARADTDGTVNYADIFIAMCGLHGEVFHAPDLNPLLENLGRQCVPSEHEFATITKHSKMSAKAESIPQCAKWFLWVMFYSRIPGHCCDIPDVILQAHMLNRKIFVIDDEARSAFSISPNGNKECILESHIFSGDDIILQHVPGHFRGIFKK